MCLQASETHLSPPFLRVTYFDFFFVIISAFFGAAQSILIMHVIESHIVKLCVNYGYEDDVILLVTSTQMI